LTPEILRKATEGPEGSPVDAPSFVTESDDLASWIQPMPGKPLEFRTRGQTTDVSFVPFNKLFAERYGIYWHVHRKGSP
jgi:hypothetical protein